MKTNKLEYLKAQNNLRLLNSLHFNRSDGTHHRGLQIGPNHPYGTADLGRVGWKIKNTTKVLRIVRRP